jgi:hypothetical protein
MHCQEVWKLPGTKRSVRRHGCSHEYSYQRLSRCDTLWNSTSAERSQKYCYVPLESTKPLLYWPGLLLWGSRGERTSDVLSEQTLGFSEERANVLGYGEKPQKAGAVLGQMPRSSSEFEKLFRQHVQARTDRGKDPARKVSLSCKTARNRSLAPLEKLRFRLLVLLIQVGRLTRGPSKRVCRAVALSETKLGSMQFRAVIFLAFLVAVSHAFSPAAVHLAPRSASASAFTASARPSLLLGNRLASNAGVMHGRDRSTGLRMAVSLPADKPLKVGICGENTFCLDMVWRALRPNVVISDFVFSQEPPALSAKRLLEYSRRGVRANNSCLVSPHLFKFACKVTGADAFLQKTHQCLEGQKLSAHSF